MSQSRYNNSLGQKLAVKLQILITLFLICIATAVQAQEKITLGLTGVTLKEDVFRRIHVQQTDRRFKSRAGIFM